MEMNTTHPMTGYVHGMYALHAVAGLIGVTSGATIIGAFVFGLPSIIAIIMNYARRDCSARQLAGFALRMAAAHVLDRGGHRSQHLRAAPSCCRCSAS